MKQAVKRKKEARESNETQLFSAAEYVEKLSRKRQAKIEVGAQRWQFALQLSELRTTLERTQREMAEILGVTQPAVSQLEHQNDMMLSTIASYVQALGGKLEVSAAFGDQKVPLVVSEDESS